MRPGLRRRSPRRRRPSCASRSCASGPSSPIAGRIPIAPPRRGAGSSPRRPGDREALVGAPPAAPRRASGGASSPTSAPRSRAERPTRPRGRTRSASRPRSPRASSAIPPAPPPPGRRWPRSRPADAEAAAALERLHERLDARAELAAALERRLARGFDPEAAARLAELRRTRLGRSGGRARCCTRSCSAATPPAPPRATRSCALAATPGEAGRDALELADAALAAAGEHAQRIAAREGAPRRSGRSGGARRAARRDPRVIETRPRRARDGVRRGVPRVRGGRRRAAPAWTPSSSGSPARPCNEDALCDVWEEAAQAAAPEEAHLLRRRAARLRTRTRRRPGGDRGVARGARRPRRTTRRRSRRSRRSSRRRAPPPSSSPSPGVARRSPRGRSAPSTCSTLRASPRSSGIRRRRSRAISPRAPSAVRRGRARSRGSSGSCRAAAAEWLEADSPRSPTPRAAGTRRAASRCSLKRARRCSRASADPRRAIEAYADVLAERPREPGAVAGLERLLARPDARGPPRACSRTCTAPPATRASSRRSSRCALETADDAERARSSPRSPRSTSGSAIAAARSARSCASCRARCRAARTRPARAPSSSGSRRRPGACDELAARSRTRSPRPARRRRRRSSCGGGSRVISADRLGRPDAAARWFEEVAASAPSAEVLGALARVLPEARRAPRSWRGRSERLADVAPAAAARKELLLEVAKIMAEQLSDRDGAMAAYRKILAVDPEDPNALRLLGKLLGAAERWDELAEVLSREVAVAERQPNLVAEAAELRFRLGRIRHQRLSDAGRRARLLPRRARRRCRATRRRSPRSRSWRARGARARSRRRRCSSRSSRPRASTRSRSRSLEARAAHETEPGRAGGAPAPVAERVRRAAQEPRDGVPRRQPGARARTPTRPSRSRSRRGYAEAAGLGEELAALLAEHADRAREPAARAESSAASRASPARTRPRRRGVAAAARSRPGRSRGDLRPRRGAPRGGEPEALAQALRRALAVEDVAGGARGAARRARGGAGRAARRSGGRDRRACRALLELAPAGPRRRSPGSTGSASATERWVDLARRARARD